MNSVILAGRVTKDIDLKYSQSGTAMANMNLAVAGTKKDETDFINVKLFGKTAENSAQYLTKGSQCIVQGRIKTGSYEKDGKKVYTMDVIANNVEFIGSKPKETKLGDVNVEEVVKGVNFFDAIDDKDCPF